MTMNVKTANVTVVALDVNTLKLVYLPFIGG